MRPSPHLSLVDPLIFSFVHVTISVGNDSMRERVYGKAEGILGREVLSTRGDARRSNISP